MAGTALKTWFGPILLRNQQHLQTDQLPFLPFLPLLPPPCSAPLPGSNGQWPAAAPAAAISCWWVEGVNGWNWRIYIYIDPDRIFRSRYIGIGSRYIEINFLSVWSLVHTFSAYIPFWDSNELQRYFMVFANAQFLNDRMMLFGFCYTRWHLKVYIH